MAETKTLSIDNMRHARLKKAARKNGTTIRHMHTLFLDFMLEKTESGKLALTDPKFESKSEEDSE